MDRIERARGPVSRLDVRTTAGTRGRRSRICLRRRSRQMALGLHLPWILSTQVGERAVNFQPMWRPAGGRAWVYDEHGHGVSA